MLVRFQKRYLDPANDLYLEISPMDSSGRAAFNNAGSEFVDSTWHHVVIVRNELDVDLYVNGVQFGSTETLSTNNAFILS